MKILKTIGQLSGIAVSILFLLVIFLLPLFLIQSCTTISVEKTGPDTYIAKYSTFWTTKHYEDVEISKDKDGGVTVKFGKVDSVKSESKLLEKLVDRIPVGGP